MEELLRDWCLQNQIILENEGENIYSIEGIGNFLLLEDKEKLFNEHFFFNLSGLEVEIAGLDFINFILFYFGERFYYCPVKKTTILINRKDIIEGFQVDFNDFLYLGQKPENDFCNLGIHTEYELLTSIANIKTVVKKAKFLNQKAIGICDKNTLAGALSFQLTCEENKIKSIIGETVVVVYEDREDAIPSTVKLYVRNDQGWLNLLKINKIINVDYKGKYIIESDLLKYSEGLFCVFDNDSELIAFNDIKYKQEFSDTVEKYSKRFDRVFYSISSNIYTDPRFDLKILNSCSFYLNNFLDDERIHPLFLDDVYFPDLGQNVVKNLVNKIESGRISQDCENSYLKSKEQFLEYVEPLFESDGLFEYCGFTSVQIAKKCIENINYLVDNTNFKIETGVAKVPKYDYSKGETSDDFFVKQVLKGFNNKILSNENLDHDVYYERLNKELDLMIESGFADYFLILWDITKWARKTDKMVGIARGSAGGSLVTYCLGITDIDPIRFDLMFERFMNPARVLPDKDVFLELENGENLKINQSQNVRTQRGVISVLELTEDDEFLEIV